MTSIANTSGLSAPVTLSSLRKMKGKGERFACLTAYDASFAGVLESAGVEVLLVGDSLGMVIQGHESTLPVALEDMIYHSRCVCRGSQHAMVMVDMPFMSDLYPSQALSNAARLMKEGGAHIVKIEGGAVIAETIRLLSNRGLPVCAHLGLLPQSVHKLGGYRFQGKDEESARKIIEDASVLVEAGADLLLLECVPAELAADITRSVDVPVIGIGAGAECDGQVLVSYDMLGITPGGGPSFSKNFLMHNTTIQAAVEDYVRSVKEGAFPSKEYILI